MKHQRTNPGRVNVTLTLTQDSLRGPVRLVGPVTLLIAAAAGWAMRPGAAQRPPPTRAALDPDAPSSKAARYLNKPAQQAAVANAGSNSKEDDRKALLAAFKRDPRAEEAWLELEGWSEESGVDVCEWERISCCNSPTVNPSLIHPCDCDMPQPLPHFDGERITKIYLEGRTDLAFELGAAISNLTAVTYLNVGSTGMYGTLPKEIGQLAAMRKDIAEHQCDSFLGIFGTNISGTIPAQLGNLTQVKQLFLHSNHNLSGTVPAQLGRMSHLERLGLFNQPLLTGSIPAELGQLSRLQDLYMYQNPAVSGTVPPELGNLSAFGPQEASGAGQGDILLHSYPRLSGTIPGGLIELQSKTTQLQDNIGLSGTMPRVDITLGLGPQTLDISNTPLLSGTVPAGCGQLKRLEKLRLNGDIMLSGSLPVFNGLALKLLDVQNCSFSNLPASLPSTITHLYLANNPVYEHTNGLVSLLQTLPDLGVLDVGFVNTWPVFGQEGLDVQRGYGSRLTNPTQCRIGQSDCAFVLHLYDQDNNPLHMGGLVSQNLTIRLGKDLEDCAFGGGHCQIAQMQDNRDGSFIGYIPSCWIRKTGKYIFQFFRDETEFKPMQNDQRVPILEDCNDKRGGDCKELRTVEFTPRECLGAHTEPDESGASCRCKAGFEVDSTISTKDDPSCFRNCGAGETYDQTDGTCVCTANNYDSTMYGNIVCATRGYLQAGFSREVGRCVPCLDECMRCELGIPFIREGWRLNSTNDAELRQQIADGANGRTQWIFSCPYSSSNCPEIDLSQPDRLGSANCTHHHDGALCATCLPHYSRAGSSDNSCISCSDIRDYLHNQFGLPLAGVIVVSILGVLAILCCCRAELVHWMHSNRYIKTNLRILLGSAQILSLIPTVLELVFPPKPRAALSYLAVVVADIRGFLRLECYGWTWYNKWLATVCGPPLACLCIAAVYWGLCWFRNRKIDEENRGEDLVQATQRCYRGLGFCAMFFYPQLSACIFSALECRQLGESSSWLEADYSIGCRTDRYLQYRFAAQLLVVFVPVGFPLILGYQVRRLMRISDDNASYRETAQLLETRFTQLSDEAQGEQIRTGEHYRRMQEVLGFCISDFRPECYWFEPCDMFRKLALTALLQFVHRGTAAQCFFGCALAFVSFGIQQWLRPYRDVGSNLLKAMVDTQLFLTFLISFILRVLPDVNSSEPFEAETYAWWLLISMLMLVLTAVCLTVAQGLRSRRKRANLEADIQSPPLYFAISEAMRGAVRQNTPPEEPLFSVGSASGTTTGAAAQSRPASPGLLDGAE
eukprot:COSAG02_NODE_1218_length_13814_cov_250.988844_5_plen_1293_part_00